MKADDKVRPGNSPGEKIVLIYRFVVQPAVCQEGSCYRGGDLVERVWDFGGKLPGFVQDQRVKFGSFFVFRKIKDSLA